MAVRQEVQARDRTALKEEQIMAGARQVFMDCGFEGASIDEIARVAGVSKPTLYRYFSDKRHLYAAIFKRECERYADKLFPADLEKAPLADALDRVARSYISRLASDETQGAFRIAVGDAQLFPELARGFYAAGPGRGVAQMEKLLSVYVARGELEIDDITLAASQFLELCKADLFYKRVFGVLNEPDQVELNRVVAGAVRVFLRAYGVRSQDCSVPPII